MPYWTDTPVRFLLSGNQPNSPTRDAGAYRMVPCKPFKMAGPESDFDNITCGEFEDAEIFTTSLKKTPTKHTALAATLYRRPVWLTAAFDAAKMTGYLMMQSACARILESCSPDDCMLFLWYCGCRAHCLNISQLLWWWRKWQRRSWLLTLPSAYTAEQAQTAAALIYEEWDWKNFYGSATGEWENPSSLKCKNGR